MYKIVSVLLLFVMAHSIGMDKPENHKAKQLSGAIVQGNQTEFERLLAEGVSPLVPYTYNHKDGYETSRLPAVYAILSYRYEMLAKLLETSPENQIPGTQSGTLMEFAAMKGSHECIPLLLSHGAVIDEGLLEIALNSTFCTKVRKQKMIEEISRRILESRIGHPLQVIGSFQCSDTHN